MTVPAAPPEPAAGGPQRPVPAPPLRAAVIVALAVFAALLAAWEWRLRALGLLPGDLGDSPAAWAGFQFSRPDFHTHLLSLFRGPSASQMVTVDLSPPAPDLSNARLELAGCILLEPPADGRLKLVLEPGATCCLVLITPERSGWSLFAP